MIMMGESSRSYALFRSGSRSRSRSLSLSLSLCLSTSVPRLRPLWSLPAAPRPRFCPPFLLATWSNGIFSAITGWTPATASQWATKETSTGGGGRPRATTLCTETKGSLDTSTSETPDARINSARFWPQAPYTGSSPRSRRAWETEEVLRTGRLACLLNLSASWMTSRNLYPISWRISSTIDSSTFRSPIMGGGVTLVA